MLKTLGSSEPSVNLFGLAAEEDVTETSKTPPQDPLSEGTRRKDLSILAATGEPLTADVTQVHAGIDLETQQAVMAAVQEVLQDPTLDAKTAAEKLEDIRRTGEVVPLSDYWTLTRQALAEKNAYARRNQVETALKYEYLVESLTDKIRETRPDSLLGRTASWAERFFVRDVTVGAIEAVQGEGGKTTTKFLNALSGEMSFENFKELVDSEIEQALEEGVLFSGNYKALQDLYGEATRLEEVEGLTSEHLMGFVDLVGWLLPAGQLLKAGARGGKKAVGAIARSPTPATQAGLGGGHTAATEAAEKILKQTDDVPTLSNTAWRSGDDTADKAPVRPLPQAAQEAQTFQEVYDEVRAYVARALGKGYDEDSLKALAQTRALSIAKTTNRPLNDHVFNPENGMLLVRIGHFKTGAPVSKTTAQKIAKDIPEARVVPVDQTGKKFVVEISKALDTDEIIHLKHSPIEVEGNFVQKALTKVLGNRLTAGSYLRDLSELTGLAQRAETGTTKITEALAVFGKPLTKLKASQIEDIGEIVQELNSGALRGRRSWFTEEQFIEKYKLTHAGKTPSKKVVEGYKALVALSDYAYVTKASMMIREMHKSGFRSIRVEGLDHVTGQRVSRIPDDVGHVVDATTGRVVELDRYRGPLGNIYKVDFDIEDITYKSRYVVDTDTIRPLEATDVLGYNAGGSRINPEANYFVSFSVDGKIVRVALSTFSQKEAALATKELQVLVDAARKGLLTDSLVAANSSWNKMVSTVDEFTELALEEGWDLTKEITVFERTRDSKVFQGANEDVFMAGGSLEEFTLFERRRNDVPLLHYGGARTYNDNPVHAVLNQVNTVSRKLAYENYNEAAIVSLGKAVKDLVGHKTGYSSRDYFNEMEALLKSEEKNPLVRTLLERKRIFELRTGVRTEGEKLLQNYADNMTEWLYEVTGLKLKIGSPEGQLTKYGFFNTFFADPFQLVLQSAGAAAILTMYPITGWKGMNLGRTLLQSTHLPRGPELNLMVKRMAKHFDMSEEDIWDLRQTFVDLGRYEIDPESVAEGSIGRASSIHVSKRNLREAMHTTGKAWDTTSKAGLWFFNKGEQISRVTSFGVSAVEYRKAFPKGRFNSAQAVAWITDKEQALTVNMTQASKSAAQQGLMKVPTQFYSFMFRSLEGIFIGKNLTPQERIGLGVFLGPLFGMSGMAMGGSATKVIDALGLDHNSVAAETIRNGPIEGLMDWIFDGDYDVGLASRLSLGDSFVDVFRSFQNENMFEVLAGAGGGKAGAAAGNVAVGVFSIFTGAPHYGTIQLTEALRETKVIDNVAKLYGLIAHDVYQSKSGKRVKGLDLSLAEKISVLGGVPLGEVQEYYDGLSLVYGSQKSYSRRSKALKPLVNELWDAVGEGNTSRVDKISKEISALIELSDLTEEQKGNLRNQVLQGTQEKTTVDLYFRLLRMGHSDEAEAYAKRNEL